MSSIQMVIQLNDQFSAVINNIICSVGLAVSAMYDMQESMNAGIDTSSMEAAREEINQTAAAANAMNEALDQQAAPDLVPPAVAGESGEPVSVPVEPPGPIEVPVQWHTDGLEVFTGSGINRFEQEVQSANNMLYTLRATQAQIAARASQTDIFPPEMLADIGNMQNRLQGIQQRILAIESNPLNMGTDTANMELEQLRTQLNQAVREQERMNQAVRDMDVSAANEAYLRLSQTVSGTERYIRDNVDEQGRFNQDIQGGVSHAGTLLGTIKQFAADLITPESVAKVLELSDSMVQTRARLDLIVDDGGSVEELQDKIFASAQAARGSYTATIDAVSTLGIQAPQAFRSNDELIGFTELLNKQFVNAGTSEQGMNSVMQQITQSMAAGGLQGEDLSVIMENTPAIVQDMQRYLQEVQGIDASNIKDLASEGVLTAEVIKNSMFYAADETNAKFESMPMTFGQSVQSIKNTALKAFEPILQKINEVVNSEEFQTLVDGVIMAIAILASILLDVFDAAAMIGGFIADNWSVISPIVYGIVAALGAYLVVAGIVAVINGIQAISEAVKTAAQMLATDATVAETTAQSGLNATLLACPLTWIILLLIALVVAIFVVCNAIAKMTGAAGSGFGIITGCVNVVIQFFKNLALAVANNALGMGFAIEALASNMKTAFHNAISSIKSWFYDLLSTGLTVIAGICEALNKLPFVEFDYSGLTSAADDFARKAAEAAESKGTYKDVAEAFNKGNSTFDTFQEGWAEDAFNAGAAWGDGIADKVGNFSLSDLFKTDDQSDDDQSNQDDYLEGLNGALDDSGLGENIGNIADNTSAIKDSMDITGEELKYLRDIAEQEVINRYTTAEIKVDMSGMQNNINNGDDIDRFLIKLTDSVNEAVDSMTEGVHA